MFREARRPSIVHSAARKLRQSPLAQLYFAAYQEVSGIPEVLDKVLDDLDDGLNADRLEAVNRALRRAAALEVARLEHYLPFLATTASATKPPREPPPMMASTMITNSARKPQRAKRCTECR